jgi:hypothetical protein
MLNFSRSTADWIVSIRSRKFHSVVVKIVNAREPSSVCSCFSILVSVFCISSRMRSSSSIQDMMNGAKSGDRLVGDRINGRIVAFCHLWWSKANIPCSCQSLYVTLWVDYGYEMNYLEESLGQ